MTAVPSCRRIDTAEAIACDTDRDARTHSSMAWARGPADGPDHALRFRRLHRRAAQQDPLRGAVVGVGLCRQSTARARHRARARTSPAADARAAGVAAIDPRTIGAGP